MRPLRGMPQAVVCNDVRARNVQLQTAATTLGKAFDTHGPSGPAWSLRMRSRHNRKPFLPDDPQTAIE